jgi:hypothetical protein
LTRRTPTGGYGAAIIHDSTEKTLYPVIIRTIPPGNKFPGW